MRMINKYHGKQADKIKKLVVQEIEGNNTGSYVALRKVLEKVQVSTGLEGLTNDGIRKAAGVEAARYPGDATATIMDEAPIGVI